MTIRSVLLLIAVLASTSASAWHFDLCSHAKQKPKVTAIPDFPKRPYDVFLYILTLDLRQAFEAKQPFFSGTAEIHLNTTDMTDVIELDAESQLMTKVVVNGTELHPTPQPIGGVLSIPLTPAQRPAGTHLTITIDYDRAGDNNGAHFYPKGRFVGLGPKPAEDSVFVEEDIFYTMSEPFSARQWMPCNDHPHDKMDAQISVFVPSGITVTSNGELVKFEPGDATDRWQWRSDQPLTTYLMVVNASTYKSWHETVERQHDPTDSIPLSYYVWQVDYDQDSITNGSKYNAQNAFKNTGGMMRTFEKRFGPYPFKRYGQTVVQPITIGGMEHQSMTTINRSWLRGWAESGVAHEVGHQWFGDKVTCETFKDLWLNESFATFTEAIYAEGWGGYEWYLATIAAKADGYFDAPWHDVRNDFPIYDPPSGELFNGAITYNKGACVIHHLRRLVDNDSVFFAALQGYLDAFAYGNANTGSFKSTISNLLGLDLTEFFDQWIYGALHPEFDIYWAQNENKRVFLRINQTQTVRNHFSLPVRFFAYHGTKVDTIGIDVASRTTSWNGLVSGTVDSLKFDRDYGLLSTHAIEYDASLGVHEALENATVSVDASSGAIVCRNTSSSYRVDVYDALGKLVLTQQATSPIHRMAMTSYPSGIYTVRITDGQNVYVRSVPVVK